MSNKLKTFTNGIIKENPVLVLVLGTCPTIATSTSVLNALGMGLAATFVLLGSNIVISLLRNIIPNKVRIPCFIVVIAGFVSVVQLLLQAYVQSLYQSLGIFLPLIVVNCIILGRAEMFASKNNVIDSALDGLGMGLGFTLALFCMATVREDPRQRYLVRHHPHRQSVRSHRDHEAHPRRLPRLWRAHRHHE